MSFAVRLLLVALVLGQCASTFGQSTSILNPTNRICDDEMVRLLTPAPGPRGSFRVLEEGKEVPYQVEAIDGSDWIWVCSTFQPGERRNYHVAAGKPAGFAPRVKISQEAGQYVLDNGLVAVRLPAEAGDRVPGPIASIKLGDKWVGGSTWHSSMKLSRFTAAVIGDGTLLAKVRLRYEFTAPSGFSEPDEEGPFQPPSAEVDVALAPGWSHAEILERHRMSRDDYWEFAASKGWSPDRGVSKPFGHGFVAVPIPPADRPLVPGALPYQKPDLFINLVPRWDQHYKDGWFFAATDGTSDVGAVVVSAGRWVWPHDNGIQCLVNETGTYAGLRLSAWHGQRLWWLIGPTTRAAEIAYVTRHAWEALDKLNHEFILDWPGRGGAFAGMNFYDTAMNPTGGLRHAGRDALANPLKQGDLTTLTRAQVMLNADAFGSYADHWSPENCNFFTDFNKLPIALIPGLRGHPRFGELRKAAEAKMREDLNYSVTLPGGAGQECPGYLEYALRNWVAEAEVCRKYLGFDPATWERYKAAEHFLRRITQPDGNTRRMLPIGDTHPSKDGPEIVDVPADEARAFATEELPGFGVIFNDQAATPKETYLAFKSGPNRGHYHGDQLSIHFCADARPLAVYHHCSYHPRAGQEHMQNRVAFHTDAMPYANMDGYERLIGFKKSDVADVAVGQVESDRLREVAKRPPETWDQRFPQHALNGTLVYRRTVVFVKGGPRDYVVLRDQFWSPEPLFATFCLHVLSDRIERKGRGVHFGNLTLWCAHPDAPDIRFESFPFTHDNGGVESTQGARLTQHAGTGEFISVLYPGPAPEVHDVPGGVRVGRDEITFAGDQQKIDGSTVCAKVVREGAVAVTLNGGDIDFDRSQGDVGLFVPDAGYPFGDIPDWLIRQRCLGVRSR